MTTAILTDSDTLDDLRALILRGDTDHALQTLDILTSTAPRSEERQATSKQRWYLHTLTTGGWLCHWKTCLLPIAEASRMIDELTHEGVTEWEGERYIIKESQAQKHSIRTDDLYAGIPF